MKYVILHGRGLADVARRDLGGKTPLESASTPNLDRLAGAGELGVASFPGESSAARDETAPLAVLGYDPAKSYPGPAPFEAAGLGVALGEQDVAFRCDLVTLVPTPQVQAPTRAEVRKLDSHLTMGDATSGGIDSEAARELIDAANEQLGSEAIQFYPGIGHRHVMVWVNGKGRAHCRRPGEALGKPIGDFLPTGDGADILRQIMEASLVILRDHPVNGERRTAGLKPANCLWLWGQGKAPQLSKLTETRTLAGLVISASDLARGMGVNAGLEAIEAAEFSEDGCANFSKQVEITLRELRKHDLVYVHVDLPADIARQAEAKAKVDLVEEFDRRLVGPLMEGLTKLGPFRLLVVCDHASAPPEGLAAPYVLCEGPLKGGTTGRFSETAAEKAQPKARDAVKLISRLLPRS